MGIRRNLAIAATALLLGANVGSAQPVSIELGLLVDVSGSVQAAEFNLQRQGYVNAFNDGTFWTSFGNSGRTLAVTMTQWSSSSLQIQGGWYLINDATSAAAFATQIGLFGRCVTCGVQTGVGDAILFGKNLMDVNSYVGARRVLDVSGDGESNTGGSAPAARTTAQNAGITVNGLAIGDAGLEAWYNANVRTSDGFVEVANTFDDFDAAIARKIGREINVVPEPSTYLLMASGLMGIAIVARRRRSV